MKKLMKYAAVTTIALTAIGVAVRAIGRSSNRIYRGTKEPTTFKKGDMWFKPDGTMKIY